MKPALLPVVAWLSPALINVVTGSAVVEQVFGIPGMGRYFVQGALNRDYTLVLGVVLVVVPALLMVSTIRFRSFKTIDLGERRRYQILIPIAAVLALIVTYPHEVLLIMAYAYLASGFVDLAVHKWRGRDHDVTPPPEPSAV